MACISSKEKKRSHSSDGLPSQRLPARAHSRADTVRDTNEIAVRILIFFLCVWSVIGAMAGPWAHGTAPFRPSLSPAKAGRNAGGFVRRGPAMPPDTPCARTAEAPKISPRHADTRLEPYVCHEPAARLHICAARGLERVGCNTCYNILKPGKIIKI
jgi:hypothetical protein